MSTESRPVVNEAGVARDGPDEDTALSKKEATDLVSLHQEPARLTERNEGGAMVLAARAEAEIKARAIVALNRPRSFATFRRKLLEACVRPRFADAAIYSKPVGGKPIEGLSIRFAEECARHYTNLDISSMVVGENDDYRTIECCVTDLETNLPWRQNVIVPKTVERRSPKAGDEIVRKRLNSQNVPVYIVRATDDQIFTQQNALIAKTLRNLILNHIPSDVKEEALEEMEAVLAGEVRKDPVAYRKRLRDAFFRYGVTPEQLKQFLGHSIEDANEAELFLLQRIGQGIKQGEATWADVMTEKFGGQAMESSGASGLRGAVLGKKAPVEFEPARITALRTKKHPTADEQEEVRSYDLDHPKKA
jgi:hypothetical protein